MSNLYKTLKSQLKVPVKTTGRKIQSQSHNLLLKSAHDKWCSAVQRQYFFSYQIIAVPMLSYLDLDGDDYCKYNVTPNDDAVMQRLRPTITRPTV